YRGSGISARQAPAKCRSRGPPRTCCHRSVLQNPDPQLHRLCSARNQSLRRPGPVQLTPHCCTPPAPRRPPKPRQPAEYGSFVSSSPPCYPSLSSMSRGHWPKSCTDLKTLLAALPWHAEPVETRQSPFTR